MAHRFEETFGAAVHEGYGLTEMSGLATTFALERRRKAGLGRKTIERHRDADREHGRAGSRRGSVPRPFGHPRLLERPGGHGCGDRRYGWLSTGDLGYLDEDRDLFLVDRRKEMMIIRGGYNVYPREVEEVLYEHPAVLEPPSWECPTSRSVRTSPRSSFRGPGRSSILKS